MRNVEWEEEGTRTNSSVINRLIIVQYAVIPANAGIQGLSGCRIKSGMTRLLSLLQNVRFWPRSRKAEILTGGILDVF